MHDLVRVLKRRINGFNRSIEEDEGLRNDLSALKRPVKVQIFVPDRNFRAFCILSPQGIHGFEENLHHEGHDILLVGDHTTLLQLLEGRIPYDAAKGKLKLDLFLGEADRTLVRHTLTRFLETPAPRGI